MSKGTTIRMWRRTIFVLLALIIVGFGAIVFSLARLQLVEGSSLQTRAVDQQLKDTVFSAQRGTIYDCNMKPLAESASVWKVVLEPAFITDKNREVIAEGLSKILGMDKNEIIKRSMKKTYYDELKRKVETDVKDQIIKFKVEHKIDNGIRLIEDFKRYYPYGEFAASVLGFTGTDNQGLYGLEKQYDSYLTGVPGKLVTAKNAIGTDMPFQYEQKVNAQNGNSLVLTIDEVVQHFLEKNLEEGVKENKVGNRACAIVMNVKTGAILGMAVKGDFDPNNPFAIADKEEAAKIAAMPDGDAKKAALKAAQEKQWRNKSISDTYYPGSVFKMITGSAAMEEGIVNENTPFFCNGSIKVASETIHCWRSYGHGSETFVQGLCNSCNPVFIQIGEKLGPQRFFKYFSAFGFTSKTGIDLPGEPLRTIYYTPEQLNPVELATESFGQNFSITPIQMITAIAAVSNGGYLVQPHVVSQILDEDGNIVKTADTTPKRQVISADTSARMCKILQLNATIGTAKNGYLPGYRIGGKTGTSQKMDVKQKTGVMQYIASYGGFAPADDPQIAMLVFFDEPHGGSYYGAAVAGPVFAKTMEEILPYLGVQRKYTDSELAKLDVKAPDVVGKTIDEAKSILNKQKLTPKIYGSGSKIVSQVPESGKTIPQNGTMVLFTDEKSSDTIVTVPKLTGMSLAAANKTAANAGLNISITGAALTGTNPVSNSQSIAAGTKVPPGTVVVVGFIEPNQVE
ncbi:PASTA domain-containing protein [Caproiciproducens galactitolivorans]|uniref:Stage V sporulation protein D n=1 Tax=Caproiciproducens galactitolivorans TaxID=642589 RepID=A0A4Z0Y9T5_9FIRM|nr:penicillin-binding transpeptidase domain-containing protein [Caproiciproducens galactitolivorans]QEY33590.1 PASTA domain-containing protein [Caproiciproducens galactitolivorans]QEY35854.1 PASTA domain-containing protein [Caproiciproducens galactitolivorans]TGJ75720.1 stage V sporulation protein D [Caproiciproducens galactitolivorans]